MCRRCEPNKPVDTGVCIAGVGSVVGAGWAFAHGYEGQPFLEAFIPFAIILAVFAVLGVLVGFVVWTRE